MSNLDQAMPTARAGHEPSQQAVSAVPATIPIADERVAALESIIRDTLWMACRYAHGRASYAVGMYNAAARKAVALGVPNLSNEIFAIDASVTAEMSGLSSQEFATALYYWASSSAIRTHISAQGMAARSDETAQQAQPEGQQPDPKDAPKEQQP